MKVYMEVSEINLDRIRYNQPRKLDGKYFSKSSYLDSQNATPIDMIIRTPYLQIIRVSDKYIEVELSNEDKEFYLFLVQMDDELIRTATNNSRRWFGEELSIDTIDEYHKSFLRLGLNGMPALRINLSMELYQEMLKIKDITTKFIGMDIRYDGLKFLKQQFGGEWSLIKYDIEVQHVLEPIVEEPIIQQVVKEQDVQIPQQNIAEIPKQLQVQNQIKEVEQILTKEVEQPIKEVEKPKQNEVKEVKEVIASDIFKTEKVKKSKKKIIKMSNGKVRFI